MAAYPEQYPGELQRLANMISQLRTDVDALTSRAMRVPVVDEDPSQVDPTSLWAFTDGRLRLRTSEGVWDHAPWPVIPVVSGTPPYSSGIRVWVDVADDTLNILHSSGQIKYAKVSKSGTTTVSEPPSSSSLIPKPSATGRQTYSDIFAATWSQSYRGDDTQRTDEPSKLFYGVQDSSNGRQKSLIGFDSTAIMAALAGATVRKVELYLDQRWSYFTNGVFLHLGAHTNSAAPSTWGGIYRSDISSRFYAQQQARWSELSTTYGDWFKAGTIKGVSINQLTDSLAAAGWALGVGSSNPPRLRITYVK